ncbi:MAG: hypothetical protein QOE63_1327, partial [Acidimicrobiaceae bacterium]
MEPLAALPWPNVRGKRCLGLAPRGADVAAELERRGAREVVAVDTDGHFDLAALDPFDVVVAGDVLAGTTDPLAIARALRQVTRGVLLSWEPIDLSLSLVGRGRALYTIDATGGAGRLGFNGSGHRHLLALAGFAIERVSKPFVVPGPIEPSPLRRVALRALTGSSEGGVLHRALLARPA